jgi:hypothetical protein
VNLRDHDVPLHVRRRAPGRPQLTLSLVSRSAQLEIDMFGADFWSLFSACLRAARDPL